MVQGMAKQYKTGKVTCRDFSDGSTSCASSQAWSVFFATLRKHGWDEKNSRPHSVTETVFTGAVEETMKDIVDWFAESVGYCGECNK